MDLLLIAAAVLLAWLLTRGRSQTGSAASGAASTGAGSGNDALDSISQAMAQFEGFFISGSVSQRNNNPGDIKAGGTFASYADSGDGWDALNGWITGHAATNPDWDFYDMTDYYLRGSTTAPSVDAQGNSDAYAEYIAGQLGVSPTTPVSSVLWG